MVGKLKRNINWSRSKGAKRRALWKVIRSQKMLVIRWNHDNAKRVDNVDLQLGWEYWLIHHYLMIIGHFIFCYITKWKHYWIPKTLMWANWWHSLVGRTIKKWSPPSWQLFTFKGDEKEWMDLERKSLLNWILVTKGNQTF